MTRPYRSDVLSDKLYFFHSSLFILLMELKNKKIAFLGDSITEGCGVADMANVYWNVIGRQTGAQCFGYGIGGTRIAPQRVITTQEAYETLYFASRVEDMIPDADVVVVFGGTNDYGHGDAPFGKIGDRDRGTFCGAVRWLMEYLTDKYPEATIVFMTPARRLGDLEPSTSVHRYYPSLPLKAYVDVIKETAKDYPIAVLDLYAELGIDPNQEADRVAYTAEGLHFNDAGHRVIAEKLQEFLLAL